jgi:hypothetical protein
MTREARVLPRSARVGRRPRDEARHRATLDALHHLGLLLPRRACPGRQAGGVPSVRIVATYFLMTSATGR